MLEKDCRAGSKDVYVLCKIIQAGCGEEGFAEGAEGQEEGLCCGGVGVNVLCLVGWGGLSTEWTAREGGNGRNEWGIFFEDFGEEGGLGGGGEESEGLVSIVSFLSVNM